MGTVACAVKSWSLRSLAVVVRSVVRTLRLSRAPAADRALAREILEELVEIPTTQAEGTTRAAQAIAARLVAAGFPKEDVQIITIRCERRERGRALSGAELRARVASC